MKYSEHGKCRKKKMLDKKTGKWTDPPCYLKAMNQSDCDGHMILKDASLSRGSIEHIREDGQTAEIYHPPILTKTWVCDKCGFVFEE